MSDGVVHAEGLRALEAERRFSCPLCERDAALRVRAAPQPVRPNRTAELTIASRLRRNTEHWALWALDYFLALLDPIASTGPVRNRSES